MTAGTPQPNGTLRAEQKELADFIRVAGGQPFYHGEYPKMKFAGNPFGPQLGVVRFFGLHFSDEDLDLALLDKFIHDGPVHAE